MSRTVFGRVSGNGKQLCPCQCHPDFSWMKFGDTRIHPTDVDCMFVVERRGKFLWIEWKEPEEVLTDGQKILAERLSKVPNFTVLILRGVGGVPATVQQFRKGIPGEVQPTNQQNFQDKLDTWFLLANEHLPMKP